MIEEAAIVTVLRVPKSGGIPTTKARVVRWFKKEGSKIKQGEPVVELETDKVNYELHSPVGARCSRSLLQQMSRFPWVIRFVVLASQERRLRSFEARRVQQ